MSQDHPAPPKSVNLKDSSREVAGLPGPFASGSGGAAPDRVTADDVAGAPHHHTVVNDVPLCGPGSASGAACPVPAARKRGDRGMDPAEARDPQSKS